MARFLDQVLAFLGAGGAVAQTFVLCCRLCRVLRLGERPKRVAPGCGIDLYDLAMACRGVFFALTDSQDAALVGMRDDDEVLEFVTELEDAWDWDFLCEVDKAWDAMHRCLGDGTLRLGRQSGDPLELVVLGGGHHYEGEDYVVAHVLAAQVAELAGALGAVDEAWLRARYDAIDPGDYDGELGDEDFQYTWGYLQDVRDFYQRAAKDGRSVVFTVDQ